MRLFVALDIEEAIRERIHKFVEGVRGFAPDARWVKAESLHITLKFIGERPDDAVEQVKSALARITHEALPLTFRGYGFFPTLKSARVFWIGIAGGEALAGLAGAVDSRLREIGIPPEDHAYSPHLTLARGGGGSGSPRRRGDDRANSQFGRVQEKLTGLPTPDFGTMTAREFWLYQSQLSREGSRYTKLARFALRPENLP